MLKKTFVKNSVTLCGCILAAIFLAAGSAGREVDLGRWISEIEPVALRRLLDNISPSGTARGVVIASPSRQSPNYYYYWVRDGSLVMDVVVDRYAHATKSSEKNFYAHRLADFVELTLRNQRTPTLSNGPGEPKFHVDGSAYNEPWGRPQNDGPALRANTLIHYANVLIDEGQIEKVREWLYDGSVNSVIKFDLEYVSHHWQDTCFDLWEETHGHHFYTQFVQRSAMIQGANLAERVGDVGAAQWYRRQAHSIENSLRRYWDDQRRVIGSTIDRDGGANYKESNLDSSVILALIHASLNDGFFGFSDERVLGTLWALESVFADIYLINKQGYSGIVIGRYPEDRYTGVDLTKTSDGGNPWFLTTLGFAEFYFRLAQELDEKGAQIINSGNEWFFRFFGYSGKDPDVAHVARALRAKGDDFLSSVRLHMHDGHMSEQINRNTGYMQGAADLTWSYASFLTAIKWRR